MNENKEEIVTQNEKGEYEIFVEGKGTIREIGKLDMERFIKILLKHKYVIG